MRSGLGFLVSASGSSDSSRPMNCSGEDAPNTGAEMLPICQRSPPGSSNCSAMLRWLRALSGALGLPPPMEKRATTGTGWPLNALDFDNARPSALPTNSPTAQTPLAPERRKPSNLPPRRSKVSTMRLGSTWAKAGAPNEPAATPIRASRRPCEGRIRVMEGSDEGWGFAARSATGQGGRLRIRSLGSIRMRRSLQAAWRIHQLTR